MTCLAEGSQGRHRPGRPRIGAALRVIALQYNPDTLTRTLQVQATAATAATAREALRLKGAGDRDDQARGRDRRDRPARATPTQNPDAVALGIQPQLAALEALVHPRADDLQANDALAARRHARDAAARGAADAVRLEQAARRAGARHRPVDHRGGVRRRAQPDPREGHPRPARALGRRPRLRPPRRHALHGLPARARRRSPRRAAVGRALATLGRGGAADARSAPGAARRRRRPDDRRSRRRAATPTSASRRRLGSRRRAAAGAVPAPALHARAPERFALLYEVRVRRGRPPRPARGRATSATPSCAGASPTRTASIDPARAHASRSGGRCASRCPPDVPGGADG